MYVQRGAARCTGQNFANSPDVALCSTEKDKKTPYVSKTYGKNSDIPYALCLLSSAGFTELNGIAEPYLLSLDCPLL